MKKLEILTLLGIIMGIWACTPNVSTKDISVTGADGTVYNSYQTACSKGDFDAARDYVGKMKNKLVELKTADWRDDLLEDYVKSVDEAEAYVENEELQYLASLNDEQANNRVILMINQRPIEGLEAAEGACIGKRVDKFNIEHYNELPDEAAKFKNYITWCKSFNSKCSHLLDIVIVCKNQDLAQKLLHSFRPDPELQTKDIKGNDGYCDIYAHYTNTSKETAQKKYDEAVKSGAFN